MHVTTAFAKLLPRGGLDRGVDIPKNHVVAMRHEDDRVVRVELSAEEPGVPLLGTIWRGHEALGIELVVQAHQRRAEAAERREVGMAGGTDGEVHFNRE